MRRQSKLPLVVKYLSNVSVKCSDITNVKNTRRSIIMTVMTQIILAVALVLSIIVPFGYYFIGEKSRGRYKTTIATNAFFFFGTMLVAAMVMFAGSSSVQAATGADAGIATGLGYIAAALVTGLSCIGGGIAVAAISEDQSILGKSLIFVGLAEGVALYGLIISFMIIGKL